jgi:hypothetical protein
MGRWKIRGGSDVIRDQPLDTLRAAFSEVGAAYRTAWGRQPTKAEWDALLTAARQWCAAARYVDSARSTEVLGRPLSVETVPVCTGTWIASYALLDASRSPPLTVDHRIGRAGRNTAAQGGAAWQRKQRS